MDMMKVGSSVVLLAAGILGLIGMLGLGIQWSGWNIGSGIGLLLIAALVGLVCYKQAQPFIPYWFVPAIIFSAPTAICAIAFLASSPEGSDIPVPVTITYLLAGALGGFIRSSRKDVGR